MAEISLPVFQGPLDLLLHLIEKDDLDITAVSLVAVTDQYLAAIRTGEGFDPSALAEFVAIGARLIYLKSRALLPRPPGEEPPALEDDAVGAELVELLREYRRFLQVVELLEQRQEAGLRIYTRLAPPPDLPQPSPLAGVSFERLHALMLRLLERKPKEPAPRAILPRDTTITLAQRIEQLRERLQRRGKFSFRRAILECASRLEVIISFLAVLELLRAGEAEALQETPWGDIQVIALAPAA
ncbi:ScpA family protein [Tepidiforma sp.]|uniref:segregation and condensation protein A n=1 Tax=Tepidiforma sp. TaxID=2682230 RepID=UPI002ADD5002|nr:ScpA family protein [Tepidiforma sp.]